MRYHADDKEIKVGPQSEDLDICAIQAHEYEDDTDGHLGKVDSIDRYSFRGGIGGIRRLMTGNERRHCAEMWLFDETHAGEKENSKRGGKGKIVRKKLC